MLRYNRNNHKIDHDPQVLDIFNHDRFQNCMWAVILRRPKCSAPQNSVYGRSMKEHKT